jgi:2-iminobutanoate/2-iminopropanoate deaminase
MEKRIVSTERAPAALGPYSQGVAAGPFVFLAGQLGIDPATGELVGGGTAAQAAQAFRNIEAVLGAAGLALPDVVRLTLYLADLEDFGAVNRVMAGLFPADPPARSTIQVARLPKGAAIEIEATAFSTGGGRIG